MKLQDCIGLRIFPALLDILQEDYKTRPFLDIINRLEQLGVIESAYLWQELRQTRNNLAHEYPDNTKENVLILNELYEKTGDLISILKSTAGYIRGKHIIDVQDVPDWLN